MWQDPFTTIYKPRRLRGTPANKFVILIAGSITCGTLIFGLSLYFSRLGDRLSNKIEEGFLSPTDEDLVQRSMLHDITINRIYSKLGQRPRDDRFA